MEDEILSLKEGQQINVAQNLSAFDFGYRNTNYETLSIDVSYEDNTYYVWEYLEGQNGPVTDPNYSCEFEDVNELIKYLKSLGI